jgi:hypothetical protein
MLTAGTNVWVYYNSGGGEEARGKRTDVRRKILQAERYSNLYRLRKAP